MSVDDTAMKLLSKGYNCIPDKTKVSSTLVSASFRHESITGDVLKQSLAMPDSLLQHMKELNFRRNKLDKRSCGLLAKAVPRMPHLRTIYLSWNPDIGNGGAVQLVSSLHSSQLRKLDLVGTGIVYPDFESLA